jgi:hypothetical protein
VPSVKINLNELTRRLAKRAGGAEANLQADVQTLLLFGGLNLGEDDLNVELEAPVGGGRRIDVETGFTVIETKRDLRKGNVRSEAEGQPGDMSVIAVRRSGSGTSESSPMALTGGSIT